MLRGHAVVAVAEVLEEVEVEEAVPEVAVGQLGLVQVPPAVTPQSVVVGLSSPLLELVGWLQLLHLPVSGRCSSLENTIWTL